MKVINNKFFKEGFKTVKSFLGALLIAMLFRSFLYDPYHIPSGSMKPNLIEGDYIFVSKFAYGYSRYSFPFGLNLFSGRVLAPNSPKRGDIIVFKLPYDNSTNYIKRLIGLPGDKIEIKNKIVYVNDQELKRTYIGDYNDLAHPRDKFDRLIERTSQKFEYQILDQIGKSTIDNLSAHIVPNKTYFFLGDNRDNSLDSRVFSRVGFVPEENIVGRAEIVLFSSSAKIYELWKWPFSFKINRFLINLYPKYQKN